MATLFTDIQVAVAIGVILTILLYVYQSAESVRIERVLLHKDGTYTEAEVPVELPSSEIVILQPVGGLFFAGTAEFEEHLPDVGQASRSVVIIRLRDRDEVDSTFIRAIERYTHSLQEQDNKLMLVGVDEHVLEQLEKTDILELIGEQNVYFAHKAFFASIQDASAAEQEWIEGT